MLTEIQKKIYETEDQIKVLAETYNMSLNNLTFKKKELLREKELLLNNYNLDKVKIAESIFRTEGLKYIGDGDTLYQLDKAIKDVTNNFKQLRKEYVGCKDYDRFRLQAVDCEYGYGPTHGSIVFRIGLNNEKRESNFTPDEIDACLYYLMNLKNKSFVDCLRSQEDKK